MKTTLVCVLLFLFLSGCAVANPTGLTQLEQPSGTPTSDPAPTTNPPSTTGPAPTNTGTAASVTIVTELTEDLKAQIAADWLIQFGEAMDWELKDALGKDRVQYHGRFNGKHIILVAEECSPITQMHTVSFGPYEICYGNKFALYVYENNSFAAIQEACQQDQLTPEELQAIGEYLEAIYPND